MNQCNSEIFLVCKDPNTTLYYGLDWSDRLAAGVTVADSQWLAPSGITVADGQLASPITKIKVSGGKKYMTYRVTNRITYSTGEIDDQSIDFEIEDR